MNIQYTWSVESLEKLPSLKLSEENSLSNVVTSVSFKYEGVVQDNDPVGSQNLKSSFYGTCPLLTPVAEGFIEFADLVESDILNAVKALYGVSQMQEYIVKSIEDQMDPKETTTELPWV
jgi:hypothetical protein